MIDPHVESLVAQVHDSPSMAVVAVTGAGTEAVHWLVGVAGASRTLLEASVPYSQKALEGLLERPVDQAASLATARDMARAAFLRALDLRSGLVPVAGVACTASIASAEPKRGDHRCHVAAWTAEYLATLSVTFVKGLRDRHGEEEVVSRLVLRALAEAFDVDSSLDVELDDRETLAIERNEHPDPVRLLLAGALDSVVVYADGTAVANGKVHGGVLPGSFNPLHSGHDRLAAVAAKILGDEVAFELSIVNVDKPSLEERAARSRLAQFPGRAVVLTRAPVFHEKARVLPGCTFVIGLDTVVRVIDARYYGNDPARMTEALRAVRKLGCRFLVAGRADEDRFRTLADVAVPTEFRDLFEAIPEDDFRVDISSTQLRTA